MKRRRRPFRRMRALAANVERLRLQAASAVSSRHVACYDALAAESAAEAEFIARYFVRRHGPVQSDAFPQAREMFP